MIEVNGITKKFGNLTAIQDITFQVESGMIYGLVGYNGAGKTTLLKTMADVYRPDSGSVLVNGQPVRDNPAVKQNLFLVPDDLYFLPYSGMEQMAAFYANFYPGFRMDTFHRLADAFGLPKSAVVFKGGETSKTKRLLLRGTRKENILSRL